MRNSSPRGGNSCFEEGNQNVGERLTPRGEKEGNTEAVGRTRNEGC